MASSKAQQIFVPTAAIRGFYIYRHVWKPEEYEELIGLHEERNTLDMFALKTCRLGDRITVAHLPRKISRSTKYLIDRGAKVTGKLSSTNYREFPLLQGGLETPCVVTITLPASIKGHMLIQRYKNWLKNYSVNLKKRL